MQETLPRAPVAYLFTKRFITVQPFDAQTRAIRPRIALEIPHVWAFHHSCRNLALSWLKSLKSELRPNGSTHRRVQYTYSKVLRFRIFGWSTITAEISLLPSLMSLGNIFRTPRAPVAYLFTKRSITGQPLDAQTRAIRPRTALEIPNVWALHHSCQKGTYAPHLALNH
jgi:hypothetical protein